MKRSIVSLGIFCILALFLTVPATSQAEIELKEGMSQGDFAMWLVKAIGAQSKLPPAATGEDAIKFLTGLGIIPEDGWDKDATISNEWLGGLLGEDAGTMSFEDLVSKVRDEVQDVYDERTLGVFRAQSSGTGSVPA